MSFEFLLTSLVFVATPGTGVLYTVAAGLARGRRASAIASVGCTLGILPHMLAAITGLAALMHTSAIAFQVLKYVGVAYLLYLAWRTFTDRGALTVQAGSAPVSVFRTISSGVLLNVLNPKLTLFFFAFLPQFVSPADPAGPLTMVLLSGVFMALTLVVFVGYGVFAAAVRDRVIDRPRVTTWLRRTFAAAFAALAVNLAMADR